MSPCIVIDVFGCFVYIWSIAICRLVMKSGSACGRLYMLMIVWMGLFFCLFLWICRIIVAALGISMSSCVVAYMLFLV
jgi:hypothetical protein